MADACLRRCNKSVRLVRRRQFSLRCRWLDWQLSAFDRLSLNAIEDVGEACQSRLREHPNPVEQALAGQVVARAFVQ